MPAGAKERLWPVLPAQGYTDTAFFFFFFFLTFYLFIYGCAGSSLLLKLSLVAVSGVQVSLIAVTPLVTEHRLSGA